MANAVEFTLTLVDHVSGPAKAASKALEKVGDSVNKVSGEGVGKKLFENFDAQKQFPPTWGEKLSSKLTDGLTKAKDRVESTFGKDSLLSKFLVDSFGEKGKEVAKNTVFKAMSAPLAIASTAISAGLSTSIALVQTFAAAVAGVSLAAVGLVATLYMYALKVQMAAEATDFTAKAVFGGGKATADAMAAASDVARLLGTSTDEAVKQITALGRKGIKGQAAKDLLQGMADISQLGGDSNAFADGIAQLKKGQGSAIATIEAQLGQGGQDRVLGQLAKTLGMQGKADALSKLVASGQLGKADAKRAELTAAIETAIKAGKIDPSEATNAALRALQQQTGKSVGGLAQEFKNSTITGGLENLKSRVEDLFKSFDVGKGPAVQAMSELTAALDPAGESGQQIIDIFNRISGSITDAFGNIDIQGTIDSIIEAFEPGTTSGDNFSKVLETLGRVFSKLTGDGTGAGSAVEALISVLLFAADTVETVTDAFLVVKPAISAVLNLFSGGTGAANGFGAVMRGLAQPVMVAYQQLQLFSTAADVVKEAFADASGWLSDVGQNITDGLWNGLTSAWSSMLGKFDALVALLPASVRSVLGIASPSKVMRELGGYTMQGFEHGIDSGADGVQDAMNAAVMPPGAPTLTASGIAAGQTASTAAMQGLATSVSSSTSNSGGASTIVNVDARGAKDPEAVKAAAREGVLEAFEAMGIAHGFVPAPEGT